MATSQDLNKLPKQFRPRSNEAVLNITTPEVQPNFGKPQRNSAKKMLFNVQEEGTKTLGKKQKRAQLDNPLVDPGIDKKMLKRGIYSEVTDRIRSATLTSMSTSQFELATSAPLPPPQIRRTSLPHMHHDLSINHPSVNGSPQRCVCHDSHEHSPGHSLDSGVVMDTVEPTLPRAQTLSDSLDDLTEHRPLTNTVAQVQFPLSLANNVATGRTIVRECDEHSGHVLSKQGDCVVCDVLRHERTIDKVALIDHSVFSEHREMLHNRDSGVGNELQLQLLPRHTVSSEMLPSPSKGLALSRSVEFSAAESHSMDLRSSLREKDFFETTNDLAKARKFDSRKV